MAEMFRFRDLEDSDEMMPSIRESSSAKSIAKLPPPGRIFGILFAAEPRELERGLAQDRPAGSKQGSVSKAALALIEHTKNWASSGSSLDQICIPILEHAVKSKESSNRKRAAILLRWLLQSKDVCVAIASSLETVLGATPPNNRVRLGWSILISELVQGWSGQVSVDNPLHSKSLEIFVACIPQLVNMVVLETVKDGKRRVPTRLTIAAADCLLTITNALAAGPPALPEASQEEQNLGGDQQKRSLITPLNSTFDDERSDWLGVNNNINMNNVPSTSNSDLFSSREIRELALWEQLDHLVLLVRELVEWNQRDRPLFTKGLRCIHTRLQLLASYRDSQGEGQGDVSVGASVLGACWQHYGVLILTEDKKLSSHPEPILQHWLGAVQYYLQQTEEADNDEEKRKTMEMRGYALTCLLLVLGRLDARHLETTLQELGSQILKAMFDQLRGADDSIVDLAVAILRAILFRPSSLSSSTSGDLGAAVQMESVVSMLLEMLDTRDVAARAVVLLVAEYFAANPESNDMEQLFSRLDSEEPGVRRNALDVLTELLSICTRSVNMINSSLTQMISKNLFKRLGDMELSNRVEASALFAKLDPSFTLPSLLEFLYSPDGRIRSAASAGVLSVLKGHTDQSKVIIQLLDCATDMVKKSSSDRGNKPVDMDRVLRLIPDWASKVEDWEKVIHAVLSKMFGDPGNVVIPRFLSCISSQLGERVHLLFPLVLDKMRSRPELTEGLILKLSKEDSKQGEGAALGRELFHRLSPLLALRVLPLNAFNDRTCKGLYGGADDGALDITGLLLDRVCGSYEFEDVRKVAAELTGRLLPDVMIPLVTTQLEDAILSQDLLRVKACIYAFCTSLGIRGQESLNHPLMIHICQLLTSILLWRWSREDKGYSEVGKAQHGCIDCFAMMICAELQPQRAAASDLDESPVELSDQKSQTDVVTDSPQSIMEVGKSPQIKFIEELPESEQLNSNHGFGNERTRTAGEEDTLLLPNQTEPAAKKRRPKLLIEELGDEESAPAIHSSGSHPAILSPVIDSLTGHLKTLPWMVPGDVRSGLKTVPTSFRVCMANVLISACQKVAAGARSSLASRTLSPLLNFVPVCNDTKLRGTCLQVLFTAVYHLQASSVLPYAVDLLELSIAAIKSQGSIEERVCGAKLLASLLASDEALVKDLAPRLLDAQLALSSISAMDSSPELRMICEKLSSCLTVPEGTL